MNFEIIDISGDVGLRVEGKELEEIFINATRGLYSLITDPDSIKPEKTLNIQVRAHSIESLLVNFLNELIFHFDAYGFIGRSIDLESNIKGINIPGEDSELWIKALLKGEDFDPEKHERRLLVKAATYHNLKFYREGDRWRVEIIFDI
ncbi:MAG: archease [Thermodesulfovibrionales bacterium]|nr:archease [Thermodesulfovibrionales bacterium]